MFVTYEPNSMNIFETAAKWKCFIDMMDIVNIKIVKSIILKGQYEGQTKIHKKLIEEQ